MYRCRSASSIDRSVRYLLPYAQFGIQLNTTQLLIYIARLSEDVHHSQHQGQNSYVKRAIQYLSQHYDGDIHVRDIADTVNLHPGYLHRIFKAQTGLSMIEYLHHLRIEKAKMLLAHTDTPIMEIPDHIGINSREYFSSLYKRYTGITPAAYRKTFEKPSKS